jgi:hypothetical protein
MLAREKNPRLARDLGEHRRADLPFRASASDQLPELGDPVALLGDPLIDSGVRSIAGGAREEFDPQLLEIAR